MQDTFRIKHFFFSTAHPLAIATLAAILTGCGGGGYGGTSSGASGGGGGGYGGGGAPSVTIASPGSTVNRTVMLTATPAAASGVTVTRVDFLVDGAVVGTATMSPYSVNWDTSAVSDGSHSLAAKVTDSQGMTATSTAVTVNVTNSPSFSVSLSPSQIYPAPTSSASGNAQLTVNLAGGATSGTLTLTGVTGTGANIYEAFAGSTGASLITLAQNTSNANEWDVPSGALLTADQVSALLEGKLYIAVASAANPNGEIRGQILPSNVTVVWAALSGSQEVPPVTIAASGVAATTVDSTSNLVSVHINSTGVDDATAAQLDTGAQGATGPTLLTLTQDSVNHGHWSTELAAVTSANVSDFTAGKWYANMSTPADPNGAIRGQITTAATPAAPTLTQLQTSVFSRCISCHNGTGTSLPGSMNLTAGNTYASIVNVASVEQSNLKRVAPNDPTNSYVVQKLEGAPTITGARMPFGGPYLDQATIDEVKAWISAGAQNN